MEDPYDPVVSEDKVPSYDIIEQKIKEIDNTIIVYRIYYLFNTFTYRFQLIKKDKMCIFEVQRSLLENIRKDGSEAEHELSRLINITIENSDCWTEFQG